MENNTIKRGQTTLAVKAGFWYVLSTFLSKGIAFITTPIFSRMMSSDDYGEFVNFASWLVTLFIVTSMEMFNTLPRAYYDYKGEYDKYNSSVTIASCGISICFYAIVLLAGRQLYNIISIPEQYIHILFLVLMLQAGKQVFLVRERTLYHYKTVATITFINILIPTLIAVILVWLLPNEYKLAGRIYGTYIPMALIDLGCSFYLIRRGKTFKWSHVRYALKLSLPLVVHYLAAYLLTSSNVIITKSVLDATWAAMVSISASVISILTILSEALTGAVTSWLMDNLEQGKKEKIYRESLYYILAVSVIAIGVILIAPEVVWILGGAKYEDAVQLIPLMIVSVVIQTITSLFIVILTYEKKIVKTSLFNAVAAIGSIVAKILLLPVLGVYVLPKINLIVFAFLFVSNYILVIRSGHKKVINVKASVIVIFITFGIAYISPILYANVVLRLFVILLVISIGLIFILKYRKKIIPMLRSLKKSR